MQQESQMEIRKLWEPTVTHPPPPHPHLPFPPSPAKAKEKLMRTKKPAAHPLPHRSQVALQEETLAPGPGAEPEVDDRGPGQARQRADAQGVQPTWHQQLPPRGGCFPRPSTPLSQWWGQHALGWNEFANLDPAEAPEGFDRS